MGCRARPCLSRGAATPSVTWTSWARSWARSRCAATCHVLPGRGHSLEAGSREVSGEVMDEVVRVILGWMDSL